MTKKRIGFDLGSHHLKFVLAEGDVMTLYQVPLLEGMVDKGVVTNPETFSQFLKTTGKALRLPKAECALVLPPEQVLCRRVTMPWMTEEQLLRNLPEEFDDFIQKDPEAYFCDYALCGDNPVPEGKTHPEELTMMAAAASREKLQQYVAMFAKGGFRLKVLLPREMALIELLKRCREKQIQLPRECCLIDLGWSATRVTIIRGDEVLAGRTLPTGGAHLRMGEPGDEERIHQLAVEMLRVLHFYQFTNRENELSGVHLLGGGAAKEALHRQIAETIEFPVLSTEKLMPAILQGKGEVAACVQAAGAALWKGGES